MRQIIPRLNASIDEASEMQRFVARENIRRFKEMLAGETSEEARALLQQMIEAEEAKLAVDGPAAPVADGPGGPTQE
jgi:hypothetical protein